MKLKNHQALPAKISGVSPLELQRKISVAEAAAINSLHPDTFKRHYRHLLKRIGKRRLGVTLYDAITLPPPDTS